MTTRDCADERSATDHVIDESRALRGKSIELLALMAGERGPFTAATLLTFIRGAARDGAHQTDDPITARKCLAILDILARPDAAFDAAFEIRLALEISQ